MNDVLKEAERLHRLGYAIHWLKPKSKAPVESKWTTGKRKSWEELKSTYRNGYNVGVRLGSASRIEGKFLTVIDEDVKSTNPRHKEEADRAVEKITGSKTKYPTVLSGRGNGSKHIHTTTPIPISPIKWAVSRELVKVFMPSAQINPRQRGSLTDDELKRGYRLRPAWEVSVMGEGQQVVLPPSIHPDSGKPYVWEIRLNGSGVPTLDLNAAAGAIQSPINRERIDDFQFEMVDLIGSKLPNDIIDLILTGDADDRSAALYRVAIAMVSEGYSDQAIMSVLTDRDLALGEVAYEHAKTDSRKRAADWVYNYTIKKAKKEVLDQSDFEREVEVQEPLSDDKSQAQFKELVDSADWQLKLQRTDKGKLKDSLVNVYLILNNSFGPGLYRFNEFAKRDEVWQKTPWSSEIGAEFQERDVQKIKLWIANKFGFQPTDNNIWSALINIADQNAYHPIKVYLESLPPHDGVKRVDLFLEKYLRGEAPKKYMRAVSRKTIVAMIARVFEPGVKFDTMLVLEGEQGLRKSTAISVLTSKPWFSDANLNLKNKDSISDMAGKWVLEQGEMNVMSKHDVAELKQFLSRDTDRMRPSYGRKSQDYPRQSVFIGTTNENIYLKDISGSRRFWPVKVKSECDIEAIKRDRDQIFAEALAFYRAGEPIWISDAETAHLAKLQQEERETSDELVYLIDEWIKKQTKNDPEFDPNSIQLVTLWDPNGPFISSGVTHLRLDYQGQKRVIDCLRVLGYERKTVRKGDHTFKAWVKT